MPTLEEIQSPSHRKLTPTALAEIAKARENWRDQIYLCRPVVESALSADGHENLTELWTMILEQAFAPDALARWLLSLAVPAVSHEQPASERPPIKRRTSIHPGIDRHRGRWRARCWKKGKAIFSRSYDTIEQAVAGRAEFLAGQA